MNVAGLVSTTLFFSALLGGCEEEGERVALTPGAPAAAPEAAPGAAPPSNTPAQPAQPASSKTRYAKVLEVLSAGEYTIARMDACGQEAWTAGPPTPLNVGQSVEMEESLIMEGFHSKSLDRTFDVIMFVSSYKTSEAEIRCPEPPKDDPGPGKPGHGGGGSIGGAGSKRFVGKVVETMDSGGYTYAKLSACGQESWFAGPPVVIKAGQTLVAVDGLEMTNFTSKTLGRVFPSIQFVRSLTLVEGEPKCQ